MKQTALLPQVKASEVDPRADDAVFLLLWNHCPPECGYYDADIGKFTAYDGTIHDPQPDEVAELIEL